MTSYASLAADHIWQSTLFVSLIWLVTRALHSNRATVRHRLWLVASVKFLLPFSLLTGIGSLVAWPAPPATMDVSIAFGTIGAPFSAPTATFSTAINSPQRSVFAASVLTIWGLGLAMCLFQWWCRWRRRIGEIMANRSTLELSLAKRLVLVALALAVICGPLVFARTAVRSAQVQSSGMAIWVGTWRMNLAETRFPDPSGTRIAANPYGDGFYTIRIEPTAAGLRITREAQPNPSAAVDREEITVTFDGNEMPVADADAPGRTVSFQSEDRTSFEVIRRTPDGTGAARLVRQRYTFSPDGRTLTWTWHGENAPPAWQISVLVFDRQ